MRLEAPGLGTGASAGPQLREQLGEAKGILRAFDGEAGYSPISEALYHP